MKTPPKAQEITFLLCNHTEVEESWTQIRFPPGSRVSASCCQILTQQSCFSPCKHPQISAPEGHAGRVGSEPKVLRVNCSGAQKALSYIKASTHAALTFYTSMIVAHLKQVWLWPSCLVASVSQIWMEGLNSKYLQASTQTPTSPKNNHLSGICTKYYCKLLLI